MIPIVGRFRAVARSETIDAAANATFYFDPRRVPAGVNLILRNFSAEKSNVAVPVDMWLLLNGQRYTLLHQGFRTYDPVEIGADFPQFPYGLQVGAASELGVYVDNGSAAGQIVQVRLHGDLVPTGVFVGRWAPSPAPELVEA